MADAILSYATSGLVLSSIRFFAARGYDMGFLVMALFVGMGALSGELLRAGGIGPLILLLIMGGLVLVLLVLAGGAL